MVFLFDFSCSDFLLLFFAVPLVGGGEALMVAARLGFGAVVLEGEREPFFLLEIVEHPTVGDEAGEKLKLVALRATHHPDKVNHAVNTAFAPVEPAYLEHPPEHALHGAHAVYLACGLQTRILATLI